jgi:rhodanese-related sulfurtransferase
MIILNQEGSEMDLLEMIFGKPLPSISASKLHEKLKNGEWLLVLDVRQWEEYRISHIPGAKLMPLNELECRMQELPRNCEIFCVCASGSRSKSATRMLTQAGYHAINMKGGMSAWHRANLAVKRGDRP